MSKSKSNIVKIILLVICVISLAGGVFSTVEIVQQNKICSENAVVVQNYKDKYESEKFENMLEKYPGVSVFMEVAKNKADEAQENIDKAEKSRTMFIILAAVLYVAAVLCLVFSFKAGKSKNVERE